MAQVSMTVRMDSQLKQNFDTLCTLFGNIQRSQDDRMFFLIL